MDKENFFSPSPAFLVTEKFSTKFENKFFKLTDRCDLTLYFDSKEFSFDKIEIYRSFEALNEEILENIYLLNDVQKGSYLKRILARINKIENSCINGSVLENAELKLFVKGEEYLPVSDFNTYCRILSRKTNEISELVHSLLSPLSSENNSHKSLPNPRIKPIFNPEYSTSLYLILKPFFTLDQHLPLEQILNNGDDAIDPLIFLGCGNRLADVFKQCFNAGLISGCVKKELEAWVCQNFKYSFHQKSTAFTLAYLNKIISSNSDSCRNPIIDIFKDSKTGKFSIKVI